MSRVLDLFIELCAIPSPPGEERAVADRPEYLPLGTQLHALATRR